MDYLEKQNALAEKELEARLRSIYKQAYKGVKKTADDYLDDLEGRIKTEFKKYEAGDYTPAEFAQWVKTQEARGERYKKMVDDIADRAVSVNRTASDIINGKTPSAYALNANYTAFEIEKGYNNANFELIDEEAITSVLTGTNNVEFRTVNPNPIRDYEWNKKQIENNLIAGILQGQSIPKLADSFLTVMKRNENSAYRNARTAMGSACNAGVMNTMKRGEAMGINVRKQWQSAKDGRVRDSHAFLNGQIRDIDKPFDNGLMYPCDSSGHPSEVYNCRCRLAYILPQYEDEPSNEAYNDDKQGNETYRQWLQRKEEEKRQASNPQPAPIARPNNSINLTERRKERTANNAGIKDRLAKNGNTIQHFNYEAYRQKYISNGKVPLSQIDIDNPLFRIYNVTNLETEAEQRLVNALSDLGDRFYSPLYRVESMSKKDAIMSNKTFARVSHRWEIGEATMEINPVKFSKKGFERVKELSQIGYAPAIIAGKEAEYLVTHEYAHSIINLGEKLPSKAKQLVGVNLEPVKKARAELEAVFKEYGLAVNKAQEEYNALLKPIESKFLIENIAPTASEQALLSKAKERLDRTIISKYSLTNSDEFIAEAFADAEVGVSPSEYSKKVHEIITRYFGKGE